ncbi:hypothetical protein EB796_013164 [Bugula neritina]|uniref:Uncharacterized protein n=1 Tax=Bugula neritina TaxID=10212 RepID=A0A7J7JSB1_BUGNE|nr:hypothetical protein EB796_013164 [Bugula neritina]
MTTLGEYRKVLKIFVISSTLSVICCDWLLVAYWNSVIGQFRMELIVFGSLYSAHDNLYSSSTSYNTPKIIVESDQLMELLSVCPMCAGHSSVELSSRHGAYLKFSSTCTTCQHFRLWENSPMKNKTPLINLFMSAGILFSRCLPTKTLRFLQMISVKSPSPATYFHYQKKFLHGVIREVYSSDMKALLKTLSTQELRVSGDGRFDTPGHSATFGVYTMMDSDTSKIISTELVKSTEVSSSPAMELEGLKRCRSSLSQKNVTIVELTTDRHAHITKWMREHWSEVQHTYDLWHISKSE